MMDWLRRNLLLLLFICLIAAQFMTWKAIRSIGDTIDNYYNCGNRSLPCRVIVVPE
jgi:hypothetical protein